MKITVIIRDVYGIRSVYPACQQAQLFARLAGTKTLTRYALEQIKALGYQIEVQPQTI